MSIPFDGGREVRAPAIEVQLLTAPGDYEAAALEQGDLVDLQPDAEFRDDSTLANLSDVRERAVGEADTAAGEADVLNEVEAVQPNELDMRPQIPVQSRTDYERSPAEDTAAQAATAEGADGTARVNSEDTHRVGELAMYAVGAAHDDAEVSASVSGAEPTSEPKSGEGLGIFIDPPVPIPKDWSLEKEEARLREKYGYMPEAPTADGDSPEVTAEARHGFLTVFADIIEERDPAAAATVRLSRDTAGSNVQQGSKASGGDTCVARVFGEDATEDATSHAARYDSLAREDSSGTAAAQGGPKAGGAVTMYCGKMSDIVGVEDPHGLIGGFFHDIALIFPWGKLLETDFDRACKSWFDSHPGELY
ncbi:MAG: hypothetical protein ACHQT5_01840 [Candidatus Saccharimonadales bacterium]